MGAAARGAGAPTGTIGVCAVAVPEKAGTDVRAGAEARRGPEADADPAAGFGSGRDRGAVAATEVRVPQKMQYFQAGCSARAQFTQAVMEGD